MAGSSDAEQLIDLLDRQFAYFFQLRGTPRLLRLRRLLSFLRREPRLAGLLEDALVEADTVVAAYERHDLALRAELGALWSRHREEVEDVIGNDPDDALDAYGSREGFTERLENPLPSCMPSAHRDGDRETETFKLIQALQHWTATVVQRRSRTVPPASSALANAREELTRIAARHGHAVRSLREASQTLVAPALARLLEHSELTNPRPPPSTDLGAWASFEMSEEFARSLRTSDEEPPNLVDDSTIDSIYTSVEHDAHLLHEELRFGVGLGRSRLTLIRRYAARCHAFEAVELRETCTAAKGNAERVLTRHFARYLFDQGLLPVIDPTIGGLRPDVLHVDAGDPLYVEAKQYADASPRSKIVSAYAQVWSTWARLRHEYPLHEAFLVVFRRGGPLFHPPPLLRAYGLALYSVVVDISDEGGSGETAKTFSIDPSELIASVQ